MKKYELLKEDFIEKDNIRIYLIRYLIDIPEAFIKAGYLGGYILNESILNQDVTDTSVVKVGAKLWTHKPVGKNVRIGYYVNIDEDVEIAENVDIGRSAKISKGVKIGAGCHIKPNAKITESMELAIKTYYTMDIPCYQTKTTNKLEIPKYKTLLNKGE